MRQQSIRTCLTSLPWKVLQMRSQIVRQDTSRQFLQDLHWEGYSLRYCLVFQLKWKIVTNLCRCVQENGFPCAHEHCSESQHGYETKVTLRWAYQYVELGTHSIVTYPQLLCLANTSHVMLVSDRAYLVGLWRVFRNQIKVGIILSGRHGEFRPLRKLPSFGRFTRRTKWRSRFK
jgi:hypothetical protein